MILYLRVPLSGRTLESKFDFLAPAFLLALIVKYTAGGKRVKIVIPDWSLSTSERLTVIAKSHPDVVTFETYVSDLAI